MNAVILSTACWPNLSYFCNALSAKELMIEQHDSFARQTYRNRYEILSANGVLSLTVPVTKPHKTTRVSEVRISYNENWQIKHWRALTSAYRKSPFFEFFEEDIKIFCGVIFEQLR